MLFMPTLRHQPPDSTPPPDDVGAYWALSSEELADALGTDVAGLSSDEAARRLRRFGSNEFRADLPLSRLRVLGRQFRSPLLWILFFAAAGAAATGQWTASLGLVPMPLTLLLTLCVIAAGYVPGTELLKRWFFRPSAAVGSASMAS